MVSGVKGGLGINLHHSAAKRWLGIGNQERSGPVAQATRPRSPWGMKPRKYHRGGIEQGEQGARLGHQPQTRLDAAGDTTAARGERCSSKRSAFTCCSAAWHAHITLCGQAPERARWRWSPGCSWAAADGGIETR